MNLADVPRIFAEEAQRCGLPAGWRLEFINSVRRFGQCSDGRKVIDMSRKLCSINTEERVRKTIVHEIAHALVGCRHGHDHVWKAKDIELGGDGVRCSSLETTKMPELPWLAVCPGCKNEYGMTRRPKRMSSCAKCSGGRFNAAYLLAYVPRNPVEATPKVIVTNEPSDVIKRVLELRARGLGYVDIDANFGIYGKRGWWSWKIVKAAKAAKETNE